MTITKPTTGFADPASHALAQFVRQKAAAASAELGFAWISTKVAPTTYQQLRGAFDHSLRTGAPLPVLDEVGASPIYPNPADNIAFRFWHDVSHVCRGLSFDLEDELELALWHLDELGAAGHRPGMPAYAMFEADLRSRILLPGSSQRSPLDQRVFVKQAIQRGLMPSVLAEIRRLP